MAEKMRKSLERVKAALRQKRTRIALAAIVAIVVIIALVLIFRVISENSRLSPPSNLAAVATSAGIDLSWQDNSGNETGFKIERKTACEGCEENFKQIATVGTNVIMYSDTGLSGNTMYCYQVRAYSDSSNSSYSNKANATTLPQTIPIAPSSLVAVAISSAQIDLSWQDNSNNESMFKIDRKTGAGGSYRQVATVGPNINTYSDTSLIENTTYYFRVSAYNDAGHSLYSDEAYAMTLPPEYHVFGGTARGLKQLVSVAAMTKTFRCHVYQGWDPKTNDYAAPLGSAFIVVAVSTTNISNAPLVVRRADFALRYAPTRDTFGLFDCTWSDVGTQFPLETVLGPSQSVAGVILYLVSDTLSVSELNAVYSLEGTLHIWKP
jgi:hypothetical protein